MEEATYTYSIELERDLKTNRDIPIFYVKNKTTGAVVNMMDAGEVGILIDVDKKSLIFSTSPNWKKDKVGEILLSDTDELFKFLLSDYSILSGVLRNSLEQLIEIEPSLLNNLFLKICDKFNDKGILDREKYIPVFVKTLKYMISEDLINDNVIAKIESTTLDCQEYIARSVFSENGLLTFEYEKASLNKKKLYFYLIKCVQAYIKKINKQPNFRLTSRSFQNLLSDIFDIDKKILSAFDNLVNPDSYLNFQQYTTIQAAITTYYKNMPKIFEDAKLALTKKGKEIGLLLSGYQELEEQNYNIDYIPYIMDIYKDIYYMDRLNKNELFLEHLKKIKSIDVIEAATYFDFIILNIEIIQLLDIPEEEVKKDFTKLCKNFKYENLEDYMMQIHRRYLNKTLWPQLEKLKIDGQKITKIAKLCREPSFFANSFFDDALFKELKILKAEVKNKQQEELKIQLEKQQRESIDNIKKLLETLQKLNQKVGNKFIITETSEHIQLEFLIQKKCCRYVYWNIVL